MELNPSKRAAQRHVYKSLLNQRKGSLHIVCMPGRSGWDVEHLLGLTKLAPTTPTSKGQLAPVRKVTALERDPEIAQVLRERFATRSDVVVFEGSVAQYLSQATEAIDGIFLDYFSNLNLSVQQDIFLLFRSRLLGPGAKLAIAFQAARENADAQVMQRALYEDLAPSVGWDSSWDDLDPNRRRCLAFNAMIALYRLHRLPALRGTTERTTVTTEAPRWYSYAGSSGVPMLVATVRVTRHLGGKSTLTAITRYKSNTTTRWQVLTPDGEPGIRPIERKILGGIGSNEGPEYLEQEWIRKILAFHEQHGYTPRANDIARQFQFRSYNNLVRAAGLCPRWGGTLDDVVQELRHLAQRLGRPLTYQDFVNARMTYRKPIRDRYGSAEAAGCEALCAEFDIPHAPRRTYREGDPILPDEPAPTTEWTRSQVVAWTIRAAERHPGIVRRHLLERLETLDVRGPHGRIITDQMLYRWVQKDSLVSKPDTYYRCPA